MITRTSNLKWVNGLGTTRLWKTERCMYKKACGKSFMVDMLACSSLEKGFKITSICRPF